MNNLPASSFQRMLHQCDTQYGRVEGIENDGVACFYAVPYAAAPVPPLRFIEPQPHEGWTGVRDCSDFFSNAQETLQAFVGKAIATLAPGIMGGSDPTKYGEDCLYLNIYSKAPATAAKKRPVLVWVHGGAFVGGSPIAPIYDGVPLAARGDVVVVTVGYRCGVLGFLGSDDHGIAHNLGMHDQLAAIKFVKKNIANFGGDPDNITLFGESAGAFSVSFHLASRHSEPGRLFHKAILQSGSAYAVPSADKARSFSASAMARFVDALGVPEGAEGADGADSAAGRPPPLLQRLQRFSSGEILKAQIASGGAAAAKPVCLPPFYARGETVAANLAGGLAAGVPVLAGCCSNEMPFLFSSFQGFKIARIRKFMDGLGASGDGGGDADRLVTAASPFGTIGGLVAQIGSAGSASLADANSAAVRAVAALSAAADRDCSLEEEAPLGHGHARRRDAEATFFRAQSDLMFDLPHLRTAQALARGGGGARRHYVYQLDYRSPFCGFDGVGAGTLLGATDFRAGLLGGGEPRMGFTTRGPGHVCTHAQEVAFVFGTTATAPFFSGVSDEVSKLSEIMMDSWIAFASSGDPSTPVTGSWPAYAEEAPATMVFGHAQRAEAVLTNKFLRGEELANAWTGIGEVEDVIRQKSRM